LYIPGHAPGRFIEKLAKYGDPSEFDISISLRSETNADMSFTGVHTQVLNRVKQIFK
jgi:tRNA A37 threonylcarbamoyltransferase TsaD